MTGQVIDGDRVRVVLPAKGWIGVVVFALSIFGTGATMYYAHDRRISALEQYREQHEQEVSVRWAALIRELDDIKRMLERRP